MAKVSQHTIDEIKGRIDILDVVGDFVDLKKSGQAYKALSPFSNEKTPSFFVVPSKGIFKCFSSGKAGDAITFLMEYDGLSYIEALKFLAEKYGIEWNEGEEDIEEVQKRNERDGIFIVLDRASKIFEDNLFNSQEGKSIGLSYFRERGFKEEIIKKFSLGYALDSFNNLKDQLIKEGFREEIINKAGLLSEKNEKTFDRFRGRVIFPIHNLSDKVIAFGARTLKKEKSGPKYLNSPETPVYHKSHVLYGLNYAKKAIRTEDNCYLVEGYTDVISLHQCGIENVVASSGTSLTEEQIKLMNRYSKNVTVLFDGDEAGIKASLRGIDLILESGSNVKALSLPEGEDPDSYSKKLGTYEFKKYLDEESVDFITFKVSLLSKEAANDPIKKAETIREIVESIARIPDPIKRMVYVKETSRLLEIEEGVLITEQNKLLIKARRDEAKKQVRREEIPDYPIQDKVEETSLDLNQLIEIQERESMRLLVKYGLMKIDDEDDTMLYQYLFSELDDIEFHTPLYNKIVNELKVQVHKESNPDISTLTHSEDPDVRNVVIDFLMDKYQISSKWTDRYKIFVPKEEDLLDTMAYSNIIRLKMRNIRKLISENMEKLKDAATEKDQEMFLQIHAQLKETEVQLAKLLGNVVIR